MLPISLLLRLVNQVTITVFRVRRSTIAPKVPAFQSALQERLCQKRALQCDAKLSSDQDEGDRQGEQAAAEGVGRRYGGGHRAPVTARTA